MLKGIKQTDVSLLPSIQKYGCLFLCFAECSPYVFSEETGRFALNYLWSKAKEENIISANDVLLDHNSLAKLFNLKVKYDNTHHKAEEEIPSKVKMVIGEYHYKYSHFVVLNKSKEVIFDSYGISNTVKHGKLRTMRWYYAV